MMRLLNLLRNAFANKKPYQIDKVASELNSIFEKPSERQRLSILLRILPNYLDP
jgi:hypothetical protein